KTAASGNPKSRRTMTRRILQFGNSHAGKTTDAIWMMNPVATMYAATTRYTFRRCTSSKKPLILGALDASRIVTINSIAGDGISFREDSFSPVQRVKDCEVENQ